MHAKQAANQNLKGRKEARTANEEGDIYGVKRKIRSRSGCLLVRVLLVPSLVGRRNRWIHVEVKLMRAH
jgi:hypothetical protein